MAWISNAESGASVRAKLNAIMVPISSGTVSSPQEALQISLPSGYLFYELILIMLQNETGDYIMMQMSQDSGSTFFTDSQDYRNTNVGQVSLGANSVYDVGGYVHLGNGRLYRGLIYPGSSTFRPTVQGHSTEYFTQSDETSIENNQLDFVAVTMTDRANAIRLLSYTPATERITTGSYLLNGMVGS